MSAAGCESAPQRTSVRPSPRSSSASSSIALNPVASIAVMCRSFKITISGRREALAVHATQLSAIMLSDMDLSALLADPSDERGLQEWAAELELSERTITRAFRGATGLSFAPLGFPEPVLSYAIEPKARGDEQKISGSLQKIADEALPYYDEMRRYRLT